MIDFKSYRAEFELIYPPRRTRRGEPETDRMRRPEIFTRAPFFWFIFLGKQEKNRGLGRSPIYNNVFQRTLPSLSGTSVEIL